MKGPALACRSSTLYHANHPQKWHGFGVKKDTTHPPAPKAIDFTCRIFAPIIAVQRPERRARKRSLEGPVGYVDDGPGRDTHEHQRDTITERIRRLHLTGAVVW